MGDDALDGGGGIDTAVVSLDRQHYVFGGSEAAFTVSATSGTDGTDSLVGIERLQFADTSVAIDLQGHAGTTAKVLGALFGKAAVGNAALVGVGLHMLDTGVSYHDLMAAAINAVLGPEASNAALVNLLFVNLVQAPPSATDLAVFTGLLDNGTYTQASLGVLAGDTALNAVNIDLVGLATTGLAYTPYAA